MSCVWKKRGQDYQNRLSSWRVIMGKYLVVEEKKEWRKGQTILWLLSRLLLHRLRCRNSRELNKRKKSGEKKVRNSFNNTNKKKRESILVWSIVGALEREKKKKQESGAHVRGGGGGDGEGDVSDDGGERALEGARSSYALELFNIFAGTTRSSSNYSGEGESSVGKKERASTWVEGGRTWRGHKPFHQDIDDVTDGRFWKVNAMQCNAGWWRLNVLALINSSTLFVILVR